PTCGAAGLSPGDSSAIALPPHRPPPRRRLQRKFRVSFGELFPGSSPDWSLKQHNHKGRCTRRRNRAMNKQLAITVLSTLTVLSVWFGRELVSGSAESKPDQAVACKAPVDSWSFAEVLAIVTMERGRSLEIAEEQATVLKRIERKRKVAAQV